MFNTTLPGRPLPNSSSQVLLEGIACRPISHSFTHFFHMRNTLIIFICFIMILIFCSQENQNRVRAEPTIKDTEQSDSMSVRRIRFDGYRYLANDDLHTFIPALLELGMRPCTYCDNDSSGAHNLFVFKSINRTLNTNLFTELYELEELYMQPKGAYTSNFLKLQVWHFYHEDSAKNVIETIRTLKTKPIKYVPPINWLFIQYKTKIFFISSFSYESNSTYFQQIKDIVLKKYSNPTNYTIFNI